MARTLTSNISRRSSCPSTNTYGSDCQGTCNCKQNARCVCRCSAAIGSGSCTTCSSTAASVVSWHQTPRHSALCPFRLHFPRPMSPNMAKGLNASLVPAGASHRDCSFQQLTCCPRKFSASGYRQEEEEVVEWTWGLDGLARSPATTKEAQHTALDRLRGQLLGDLRAALRHAYLGPR